MEPIYEDHCGHLKDERDVFLGQVEHGGTTYDVYAMCNHNRRVIDFCMRYGNEPHQYGSMDAEFAKRSYEMKTDSSYVLAYELWLKLRTTVYVFDHRSGFDWNINRQVVEKERDEYCKAGWLTASDAIYEIEVPVYPFIEGKSNSAVTEYLSGEDYLALGGKVLWSIAKE